MLSREQTTFAEFTLFYIFLLLLHVFWFLILLFSCLFVIIMLPFLLFFRFCFRRCRRRHCVFLHLYARKFNTKNEKESTSVGVDFQIIRIYLCRIFLRKFTYVLHSIKCGIWFGSQHVHTHTRQISDVFYSSKWKWSKSARMISAHRWMSNVHDNPNSF